MSYVKADPPKFVTSAAGSAQTPAVPKPICTQGRPPGVGRRRARAGPVTFIDVPAAE